MEFMWWPKIIKFKFSNIRYWFNSKVGSRGNFEVSSLNIILCKYVDLKKKNRLIS